MTEIELNNEYFEWMCQLVCNERYSRRLSYQKLLRHLHNIDFQYMLPMDGNRAEDGIDLRYRFGYEKEYEGLMIASYLDNRPCSVLEMLIALAFRCEEHIMTDPDIGNRMGQWFWNMIVSLGLGSMSDSRFDAAYMDDVIYLFRRLSSMASTVEMKSSRISIIYSFPPERTAMPPTRQSPAIVERIYENKAFILCSPFSHNSKSSDNTPETKAHHAGCILRP